MKVQNKSSLENLKKFIKSAESKARNIELKSQVGKFLDKCKIAGNNSIMSKLRECFSHVKKVNLQKISILKYIRNFIGWLSNFWKIVLITVPLFLFFYYLIGSRIVESIDTKTVYVVPQKNLPIFETANGMSFLIKREIDDKMWTPNLPILFPAYVLDNMPNFQIGIINSVKDIASVIRKFERNTEQQQKDIDKAFKLLSYSPKVWIMSRSSSFKLAPSSNSQYRKAAKELRKFSRDGVFIATPEDLNKILHKIAKSLIKITRQNEEHQREKSTSWLDTQADDLFYYAKGYAYASWQMSVMLGNDFKNVILERDIYSDWTYMVSSLKKAAEFNPSVVKNSEVDSLFAANHLIIQNYYLLRAVIAVEQMCNTVTKENHDNKS